MAITLSKQYNFKLNEATMEQARKIIKEKGMTMTDAISLFVEQIVLEQDLPIKTAEDLHKEQLIEELQAQSERALREYEAGEGTSLDDMRGSDCFKRGRGSYRQYTRLYSYGTSIPSIRQRYCG